MTIVWDIHVDMKIEVLSVNKCKVLNCTCICKAVEDKVDMNKKTSLSMIWGIAAVCSPGIPLTPGFPGGPGGPGRPMSSHCEHGGPIGPGTPGSPSTPGSPL